jgi:hypothetical protein
MNGENLMNSLAVLKTLTPDKVITVKAGTKVEIGGKVFQLTTDTEVYQPFDTEGE